MCLSRYEEKRWAPRNGKPESPTRRHEEKASVQWQQPEERNAHGYVRRTGNQSEEWKSPQAPIIRERTAATRITVPAPPKGPEQVDYFVCHT